MCVYYYSQLYVCCSMANQLAEVPMFSIVNNFLHSWLSCSTHAWL